MARSQTRNKSNALAITLPHQGFCFTTP